MSKNKMEELTVISKAREFVNRVGINSVPVDLGCCSTAANAEIRVCNDLDDEESGQTFSLKGKNTIMVNGNHTEERQRFTVLHEIAHIVLGLPSKHHEGVIKTADLMSYRNRPKEEVLCDVFAAECLLPYSFFKKDIDDVGDVCFDTIKRLSKRYKASITSTGSRFAVNCEELCSFVLIEGGKIRYVSSSKFLRELKGWIDIGVPVPQSSVASAVIKNQSATEQYDEIPTGIWFNNSVGNYDFLCEEAIFMREWDQCLSILWFDESLRPTGEVRPYEAGYGEQPLLEELDGVLPWPSRSRRK